MSMVAKGPQGRIYSETPAQTTMAHFLSSDTDCHNKLEGPHRVPRRRKQQIAGGREAHARDSIRRRIAQQHLVSTWTSRHVCYARPELCPVHWTAFGLKQEVAGSVCSRQTVRCSDGFNTKKAVKEREVF